MSEPGGAMDMLRVVISAQAEDPGLWFQATRATEDYLQRQLRALHAVAEDALEQQLADRAAWREAGRNEAAEAICEWVRAMVRGSRMAREEGARSLGEQEERTFERLVDVVRDGRWREIMLPDAQEPAS